MIRVRLWRDPLGQPERLAVTGHAGRGQYGQDIVCAAASVLVETLLLGLKDVADQPPAGSADPGHADLRFACPMSREARAIVETVVRGLQDLADSEPKAVSFENRNTSN